MDYIKIHNFLVLFTSILYEALPFIVLGAIIAGILEEMVPQQLFAQIMRGELRLPGYLWPIEAALRVIARHRPLAILIGGLLGLFFPMCECGIIPVMRRLLRKGVPLSCCVCYMLAGPIINVVVMASTYVAFSGMENQKIVSTQERVPGGDWMLGPHRLPQERHEIRQLGGMGMMAWRMGLGYLVAVGTSLIVEWQYRKHGAALLSASVLKDAKMGAAEEEENDKGPRKTALQRIGSISETALHDFVDITVFLILGAALAALARQMLHPQQIADLSRNFPVLAIGVMMGLAIVLCLCSEADAFVAASFSTMQPASKLAFLVLGPMLDFKLYMMYTRVFRPRLIAIIIVSVVVQVLFYSILFHYGWEIYVAQLPPVAAGP